MTTPPAGDPTWRDDPDGLDQLCEEGARDLHGAWIPYRDTVTLQAPEEYL